MSFYNDDDEDSFKERKKTLSKIQAEFKKAISDIRSISDSSNTEIFDDQNPDETTSYKSYKNFPDQEENERLIEICQLRSLVRELNSLKNETLDLQAIVMKLDSSHREIQKKFLRKFYDVVNILSLHINRAQTLLNELQ